MAAQEIVDGRLRDRPPTLMAYHDRRWARGRTTGIQVGPEITLDAFNRGEIEITGVIADGALGMRVGAESFLSYNGAAAYDHDTVGDIGADYSGGQQFLFSAIVNPDGLDWIDGRRSPAWLNVRLASFYRLGNTFMFSGFFHYRTPHRSLGGSINIWRENASYPSIYFLADGRTSQHGEWLFHQYGWERN